MRRLPFLLFAATMLTLFSCQKQESLPYSYNIQSTALIDYDLQQTVVSVNSSYSQDGVDYVPKGDALLIMSAVEDMSLCETLTINGFPFNSNDRIFAIPVEQRPLDKTYWYFIELQAPLSQPLRSEIFTMPTYSSESAPDLAFMTAGNGYVMFAKGNLQYNPSTATWRFADNQYDIIGQANQNITPDYNAFIDLFGYGTSGYAYSPSASALDASAYASSDIKNTSNDWGVYCDISNGGDFSWFTPTNSDWTFIYSGRPDADKKRSFATVNDVKGLILLPEKWTTPSDCQFTPDAQSFDVNCYTAAQWNSMENAGAVFLPAAGSRIEKEVYGTSEGLGNYYSSSWTGQGITEKGSEYCAQPIRFIFSTNGVFTHAIYSGTDVYSGYGGAVRLVRRVQSAGR